MATLLLGLGSNLGDRAANIRAAVASLNAAGIHPLQLSSLYETAPMDVLDQPAFLNAVVESSTGLRPLEVLHSIQRIESQAGRVRTVKGGPRTLDIDILSWADLLLDSPELQIPHPAIIHRRFVLEPLAELLPEWTHPLTGQQVSDLLIAVSQQQVRRLP